METRKTKLALTASALAFALMLAGCGGGGSSSSAVTPSGEGGTPPQQTPPQTVTVPSAVQSGADYADYAPAAGTIMIPAGESRTSNGVMFECEDDDCTVTVAADGMVTATGGMVTAGLTQAVMDLMDQNSDMATRATQRSAANTAIAAAQAAANGVDNESTDEQVGAADQAIGAARQAVSGATALTAGERAELMALVTAASNTLGTAKTARTKAVDAAMKAASADAEALFEGMDVDRDANNGTVDLAIALTGTATDGNNNAVNLGVTDTYGKPAKVAATVSLDGAPAALADVKATDTMVPMLGEWKGTELFGDNKGKVPSNTVHVYTDVEANTDKAFDSVYGTSSALTIDADTSSDGHVRRIMADDFNHEGTKDHAPKAGTGDVGNVTVRVPGTFHGAPGQYQCTADSANDCVSHEDDNGVRLTGANTPLSAWEFVPNPGAMVSVADDTYLYFGWWLYKDDTGPEVTAFHGVTGGDLTVIVAENFTALSGQATYKGAAAGKYAIDPVAPDTYASGGHWTADATLTADFGTEATASPGTISGMVDNFMADGEMMDWTVSLEETVLSDAGAFNTETDATGDTASNSVVWTINKEKAPRDGSWSGNLYDQGSNNEPQAATGMFTAVYKEGSNNHTIGHMVGAFGAHNEDPPPKN